LKIILTKDVDKLGSFGDIVNVKDVYAKNYLIPNGFATIATPGNIKQSEILKKSRIKVEARNIREATGIAEELEGTKLIFKVKSSPEGKLYGSITNKDIAEKILSFKKIEIDRKKIELEDSIRETGSYEIEIKLYKEIKCNVTVSVEADKKQADAGENENAAAETVAE
jgi:large subunit ribosomal protein L9